MDTRTRLLCNLRVLGSVQQNQRVGVSNGEFAVDSTWVGRQWRGDSRHRLCTALQEQVSTLRTEVTDATAVHADMQKMESPCTQTCAVMAALGKWLADVQDTREAAADGVTAIANSTYVSDVRTSQRLLQLASELRLPPQ